MRVTSSSSSASVTLWRWSSVRQSLERLAADEVVVELDVAPVAEIPRREVVVLDRGRDEAAADRRSPLVAVRGKPLAIRLQGVAGVDGGQRGGDPAGLERVRGVGPRRRPAAARTPRPRRRAPRAPRRRRPTARTAPSRAGPPCRDAARSDGRPRDRDRRHVEELQLGRLARRAPSRSTCIAFGPCTWKRYDLRRPSVRSAVRWSSSTWTS